MAEAAARVRGASFDDLVGAGEDRWRDRQAERLGGLEIDNQLRWGERSYDRLPALAADLIGRKVDLIAASGPSAFAATHPLVLAGLDLARPGHPRTPADALPASVDAAQGRAWTMKGYSGRTI